MSKITSPYYPPRARWHSRWLLGLSKARARVTLDWFRIPSGVGFWPLLGSLLVPGLGFYCRGARAWGRLAMGASGVLGLVFIVWLGYPVANVAFGLLLSIHATGLTYLLEPWLSGIRFGFRLLFSLAALAGLAGLLYLPLRNEIQEKWLIPLQVNGRVVVTHRTSVGSGLRRGDWVAYSFEGSGGGHGGLYVAGGLGLGPLLALPGERIRFAPGAFEVNGLRCQALKGMPMAGEVVVPEKHWFLWPEVAISGHGYASPETISAALARIGVVSENQIMGRPFKRWFWRRQI